MKKKTVIALLIAVAVASTPSTTVNATQVVPTDAIANDNIHKDNRLFAGVNYHCRNILSDALDEELDFKEGYTNTKVNFRNEESEDSDVIDTLEINTKIKYIDDDNDWLFVEYKDNYGYIKSEYVSDKKTKIQKKKITTKLNIAKNHLTRNGGTCYYNGRRETYYNLPMAGVVRIMRNAGFNGEYAVRSDGVKTYGGYVMVAADLRTYPRGSKVETSLGTGIVCDTGGFVNTYGSRAFDIATAW